MLLLTGSLSFSHVPAKLMSELMQNRIPKRMPTLRYISTWRVSLIIRVGMIPAAIAPRVDHIIRMVENFDLIA